MTTGISTHRHARARGIRWPLGVSVLVLLRLLTAAGLAVDAYVHADLASSYDSVKATVSQGDLFRAEAAAAALAAVLILTLRHRRSAWLFAFVVAAAGLAAVLVYRSIDVGTLGPLPNMYEPVWFPEKTASAIAEGVATATALTGLLLVSPHLVRPSSRSR